MLTSFGLKPGDVFTWDDCPFREQEGSPLKKRWFILLGFFVIESQVFVITTVVLKMMQKCSKLVKQKGVTRYGNP
jgi:hypothetical protein